MNDSSPRRGRSQLSLPKLLFFTEAEKWHCFELKGKPLRRVSHAGTEWRANNVNSVYPPSKDLMWKYCQQLPAVSFIWILRYCFVHHLLLSVSPPLPPPHRLFPRSLIGNWSCLTGSDSLRCCCALSVVMWRSVFIGNLHKSSWGEWATRHLILFNGPVCPWWWSVWRND